MTAWLLLCCRTVDVICGTKSQLNGNHILYYYISYWGTVISGKKKKYKNNTNIIEMRDTACILQDAGTKLTIFGTGRLTRIHHLSIVM